MIYPGSRELKLGISLSFYHLKMINFWNLWKACSKKAEFPRRDELRRNQFNDTKCNQIRGGDFILVPIFQTQQEGSKSR